MPLTDAKIRNARPRQRPYKLTDGRGLYLEVRPTGSKLWRYRYRIDGKENVFALGEYLRPLSDESASRACERQAAGQFTLAEARVERTRCRGLVKRGIHPAHHRKAQRAAQFADNANTFESLAREWIDKKKPSWSAYYLRQVERFLAADVLPEIGAMPIRSVTSAHLLEILRKVEGRGAATVALLLRQWMSAIFRFGVATLRADSDPAAPLKGVVQRPRVVHRKPLTRQQIAELNSALETYPGQPTTTIALRLLLLTFVRTGELRAAAWDEFDLERGEWRIPAVRMKMRETHLVPLSTQAIDLLRELYEISGSARLLFPNRRRPADCMSPTTLNRALERMGFAGKNSIGFSAHGFRATACTILNELGYRPDVIERQLAHRERDTVRASYNQAEYLNERRAMKSRVRKFEQSAKWIL